MADILRQLSTYLIENLYEHNVALLLDPIDNNQLENLKEEEKKIIINASKSVTKAITNLKKETMLPQIFNIGHVTAKHTRFYELKNCKGEHCFDCLYNDILTNKLTCEHSNNLTPYEIAHINYLFTNIQ